MKKFLASAVVLTGALSYSMVTMADPVGRTVIPAPAPAQMPGHKPMPQEPPPPQQQGPTVEEAFVQAYVQKRSPRIMVFVNRTIVGNEVLEKDGLKEMARTEVRHVASGAVNSSSARTTSVKKITDAYDTIGASAEDYEMIEASVVKYFDASGRVNVSDSDAARAKLDRAQVLRVENGDPAAARLLGVELKQEILIRITAKPTRHSQYGNAVRLVAKAVGTTDARNLGTAFVDMPLPMTKTNINTFTRYIASSLMDDMCRKWLNSPEFDPVEVRIYKTASIDDSLRIKKWLGATKGVQKVETRSATGGAQTSYASFMVAYAGAPEDLYADLKDAIGASQGLKAVDLQNNTVDLEVTGKLDLVTTTRKSETITTTTTTNVEEKRIEPINPAPPAVQEPAPAPGATDPAPAVPPVVDPGAAPANPGMPG